MEGIYNTDSSFDFTKLNLAKPQPIPGGNYFIRLSISGKPLYIRHPKCKTKQGFFRAGKKYHTDLMFTHEDTNFIEWMENLESHCQNLLYVNRDQWFEDTMEIHDIENYFTSPLKIFKSGKFYIARVNVSTNLGNPILKIYDEDENLVAMDKVDNKVDVMSVLEIKGIKCSATSFQIEMEIKQMMIMKPEDIFDKCLFRTNISMLPSSSSDTIQMEETVKSPEIDNSKSENDSVDSNSLPDISNPSKISIELQPDNEDVIIEDVNDETIIEEGVNEEFANDEQEILLTNEDPGEKTLEQEENTLETLDDIHTNENHIIEKTNDTTDIEQSENNCDLQEIQVSLDEIPTDESISIRNKDNVYYQMYKEAKSKAKVARDLAISSYLEAKRIKNLYMLNDTSDSDDSDFENMESEENDESENIDES